MTEKQKFKILWWIIGSIIFMVILFGDSYRIRQGEQIEKLQKKVTQLQEHSHIQEHRHIGIYGGIK
jgi:hypothetical protein